MATHTTLIARYLAGELTPDEQQQFEERMKDPAFREEVALQRQIIELIATEEGSAFEEDILQDIDLNYTDDALKVQFEQQSKRLATTSKTATNEARVRSMRRIWAIAASVLLLLVAGALFWANVNYSEKQLASEAYMQPDTPGTLGGGNAAADVQEALRLLLVEENYEAAEQLLLAIEETDTRFAEAQYFLGHLYFRQGDFAQAIEQYETTLTQADTLPAYIDRDKIRWNLLLAKLGNDQSVEAELEALKQSNNPIYVQKAEALETKLTSFWQLLTF